MRSIPLRLLPLVCLVALSASRPALASGLLFVGDTRLKPVADALRYLEEEVPVESVYAPSEVQGGWDAILQDENPEAVIALGRDAVEAAYRLPESVPVIYGLIVRPPETPRRNVTGVHMETPAAEYLSLVSTYFPAFRRIGAISGPETARLLAPVTDPRIVRAVARDSYGFLNTLSALGRIDALLLLPDKTLLTPTVLDNLFLFSFRSGTPVLGISEKHVRDGALLALTFNIADMGRQLGALSKKVLQKGGASPFPPAPPRTFNLFLNVETAQKMNLAVPDELRRRARVVKSE